MTKMIWIYEKYDEQILKQSWINKDMIVVHPLEYTPDLLHHKNVRLKGTNLKEKINELEEFLEQLANTGETIRFIVNQESSNLTETGLFFCMTHFPHQTEMVTLKELWTNADVNWKYEEIYHIAYHLVSMNKFSSAEILLNSYVKNKDVFHLLAFGKNLLNGKGSFYNIYDKDFYFNLLIRVLNELTDEKSDVIQFVKQMKGIDEGKQRPFIYFLQNYCEYLYKNGDLINFIVLYYRLAEELLLYAMGWDVDDRNKYKVRKRTKNKVSYKKPYSRHFNSYLRVVERELKRKPRNIFLQKLYRDFTQEWLIDFIALRHEGIGGHGFAQYSTELFEEICGGHPLDKMNELLEKYNIKARYNLFHLVQKASLALIRDSLVKENFIIK